MPLHKFLVLFDRVHVDIAEFFDLIPYFGKLLPDRSTVLMLIHSIFLRLIRGEFIFIPEMCDGVLKRLLHLFLLRMQPETFFIKFGKRVGKFISSVERILVENRQILASLL